MTTPAQPPAQHSDTPERPAADPRKPGGRELLLAGAAGVLVGAVITTGATAVALSGTHVHHSQWKQAGAAHEQHLPRQARADEPRHAHRHRVQPDSKDRHPAPEQGRITLSR